MCSIISQGFEISNDFIDPIGAAVQKHPALRNFYQNHPLGARVITVPLNTVLGALKPILLPLIAAISGVAMFVMAVIRACQGRSADAKKWLAALTFCLIAGGGAVALITVAGFHMSLFQGMMVLLAATSISIIIHVYRVAKDPKPLIPA